MVLRSRELIETSSLLDLLAELRAELHISGSPCWFFSASVDEQHVCLRVQTLAQLVLVSQGRKISPRSRPGHEIASSTRVGVAALPRRQMNGASAHTLASPRRVGDDR